MTDSKILQTYLVASGVLLILFGAGTMLAPIELKSAFDIVIPQDINVLNDVRAFSALSLAIGTLTIVGAFVRKLTYTASLVVFVQFLALGSGRVVSMVLDGAPVTGNMIGTANEFFLGAIGAFLFVRYQRKGAGSHGDARLPGVERARS